MSRTDAVSTTDVDVSGGKYKLGRTREKGNNRMLIKRACGGKDVGLQKGEKRSEYLSWIGHYGDYHRHTKVVS